MMKKNGKKELKRGGNEMRSYPRRRAMPSDKFRRLAERISKYVDFRGCETEKCINKRIRRKKSPKLNNLIKAGFAYRLLIESWISPHPVYKKILDISDEDCDALIEEERQTRRELKKWKLI
jgi:hypothetical protein